MPSLILSNPLGSDDAQEIGLTPREYIVGEVITVDDYVFATLIRTGYGKAYGTTQEILLVGNGDPTEATGVDGQWYLDLQAEVLWGPKVGGYWPSDPIRPDRGVQQISLGVDYHLRVTYSTGTVVDLGNVRGAPGDTPPPASTTVQGTVRLAGDLGGTADAPTVPRLNGIDTTLAGKANTADVVPLTQKGAAGGVATLDGGGLIPSAQLPPLAITNTFPVANQAEMLALTAQVGDVAIRADGAGTFILRVEPASVLANWSQLAAPAGGVTSVDGRTGVVSLADLYLPQTAKGAANGVASLGADGKVPAAQLPASTGGAGDGGFVLATPTADPNVPLDLSITSKWGITDPRTNLAIDPAGATGTLWSAIAGTGGAATQSLLTGQAAPFTGGPTTAVRETWTTATTAPSGGAQHGLSTSSLIPVTAGQAYTVSVYGRTSRATQQLAAVVTFYNASGVLVGASVSGAASTPGANTWARFSVTATAPAGAARAVVSLSVPAGGVAWAVSNTLDATALLIEAAAAVGTYIDGNTAGATWAGTVNGSSSTLGSQSYYDDAGAPAAEAGLLVPDPDTGSVAVWRPGAPYTSALSTRIGQLLDAPDGLTMLGRDRGSGTSLPTDNLHRSDVYYHQGLTCLMGWNGTAWRQMHTAEVANEAARTAISTTYSAVLYSGFRARQADTGNLWEWTGTAWATASMAGFPIAYLRQTVEMTAQAAGFVAVTFDVADIDTHGGFTTALPRRWTCPPGQGGTYAVEGLAVVSSVPTGAVFAARLAKNGTYVMGNTPITINGGSASSVGIPTGRKLMTLAAGEDIAMQAYCSSTWGTRVTTTDGVSSALSVERIR